MSFQAHRIKCDKSTGVIEMVMDRFTIDNEGTYTVQIQDGKAKSQSSLVLIGDGTPCGRSLCVHKREFKTDSSDWREACVFHFCFFPLNIGFSIQDSPRRG